MATTATTGSQAVRASDFLGSIGINTHIDFTWTSYGNLQLVENAINYLGIKNLRDSAASPADVGANGLWQQVADATGAKFDTFMGEGSPAAMQYDLSLVPQLAQQHLLNYIEGGNEEDDPYAAAGGNSLAIAAQFQQQVYATGQQFGLPVINMSFGAGWATSPTGDYGTVGNLGAYANYANAHTYFGTGNTPESTIPMLNSLAQMAASQPVITTEMGWYTTGSTTDPNSVSETVQAKYMLDGLLDAYKAGDVKTYLYELLDQRADSNAEDNFGLFRADGTAKPAAVALHNLTTLLADGGSTSFAPGTLSYNLTGLQATDNSLLMEKSDGTYWLAVWDESRLSGPTSPTDIVVPNHTITLTLPAAADSITVFDPLTGTSAVESLTNATTAQISLPDHPVLIEIAPGGVTAASVATTSSYIDPVPSQPVLSSNDLTVSLTPSASIGISGTVALAASISDPWAVLQANNLFVNLTTGSGTLTMTDANGNPVAGSGTSGIQVSGTLAQLNAELATLTYHASSLDGSDGVSLDVWNQAGVEAGQSSAITITTPYVSTDVSIINPADVKSSVNAAVQVSGITINDNWAEHNPGSLALNLSVGRGSIVMTDANGNAIAGSGTGVIHFSGTLDQINAALANLSYHAPSTAGNTTLTVDIWNQAGVEVTHTIALNTLSAPGNSNIAGTSGSDILSGAIGGKLTGGLGADTFYFTPTNTGNTTHADHIADFSQSQGDKIDLHGFGLTAADFAGTGALSGAKSFSYDATLIDPITRHPYTLIKIDTNGDHNPDYEIRLDNVHVGLHESDFIFT